MQLSKTITFLLSLGYAPWDDYSWDVPKSCKYSLLFATAKKIWCLEGVCWMGAVLFISWATKFSR